MDKRAAIYVRVSTDRQTIENQLRELRQIYALSLLKTERAVERQFTFNHFAIKCLSKNTDMVEEGDRNIGYLKAIRWSLQNADWGLLKWFGQKDVRKITTRDFIDS